MQPEPSRVTDSATSDKTLENSPSAVQHGYHQVDRRGPPGRLRSRGNSTGGQCECECECECPVAGSSAGSDSLEEDALLNPNPSPPQGNSAAGDKLKENAPLNPSPSPPAHPITAYENAAIVSSSPPGRAGDLGFEVIPSRRRGASNDASLDVSVGASSVEAFPNGELQLHLSI